MGSGRAVTDLQRIVAQSARTLSGTQPPRPCHPPWRGTCIVTFYVLDRIVAHIEGAADGPRRRPPAGDRGECRRHAHHAPSPSPGRAFRVKTANRRHDGLRHTPSCAWEADDAEQGVSQAVLGPSPHSLPTPR